MTADEDITEELKKLEIASTLPQVNLMMGIHTPLAFNPFYEEDKDEPSKCSAKQSTMKHHVCQRCRVRRHSESIVDKFKSPTATPLANTISSTGPREGSGSERLLSAGVQRVSLKKTNTGGMRRKNLIREPVLRVLQNSFQTQNFARRRLNWSHPMLSTSKSITISAEDGLANEVCSLGSAATVPRRSSSGLTDFRELINECTNLQRSNETSLTGRNFFTIQTQTSKSHLSTNGRKQSASVTRKAKSLSPTQNLSVTRVGTSSSSCSLQANGNSSPGNGNNISDDVNIDELASYFDVMVHIPKKMSTMAEMMYT